jgi:signal peptidase I
MQSDVVLHMNLLTFALPASFIRLVVATGLLAILAMSTGCATTGSTATITPRSNVSREHALSLAQLTAAAVGGKVYTVAPTGSMKPTLDESSVVAVEPAPFATLRRGDIIIYRSAAGAPVVHRLYEQNGDKWLVLGDNNPTIDREAVTSVNLLGRVCAIFYTAAGGSIEGEAALARR